MKFIKSYITDFIIISIIIVSLVGGIYIWNLKKDLKNAKTEVTAITKERDGWKTDRDNLQFKLDQLKLDNETAKLLSQEKAQAEIQIKEIVKDRIVYIDRAVKEDHNLNTRKLSPVLQQTIESIQQVRREQE